MFDISSKKVDLWKSNILIKKNLNLDINLDCFILISTNNEKYWELLINNILDLIIDRVSKNNSYNDFSLALENINSFIKKWEENNEQDKNNTNIFISILDDNNYIFSNIWKSSCYLINDKNELIELTNKEDNKKYFNYISNWDLMNWDIIITSTHRLLKYLSKSDLLDWIVLSQDIKIFNKNIYNILTNELLEENVYTCSLKYHSIEKEEKVNKIDIVKEYLLKSIDNNFSKKIIWNFLKLKDKINSQSKNIKNIFYLTWILIAILILYSTLSTFVSMTTKTEINISAKENIIKARNFLKIASENVSNPEIFNLNINKSKELLNEIENEKIFLADITKINDDINILKKQFNKIEVFQETTENVIYNWDFQNPVQVLKNNLKTYIVTDNSILWPIIPNSTPKINIFNWLEEWETFIDATFIWDSLYILTNYSKIVEFNKNNYFSFVNVIWQTKWQKSKEIDSYGQNLYLIWEEDNQIYRHIKFWNDFKSWDKYLEEWDLNQIWEILSIAIDWWIYILKKDLTVVKYFSSPYRIEKLILNKLPENYSLENKDSIIDLKARINLNYVYLLMNNKIWIFNTNSNNFKDTKSLTYIWQIESENKEIKDFYVNHDWEIEILNENWIYKINFEISDNRLLLR